MKMITAEQYEANVGTLDRVVSEITSYWTPSELVEREDIITESVKYWIAKIETTKTRSKKLMAEGVSEIARAKGIVATYLKVKL